MYQAERELSRPSLALCLQYVATAHAGFGEHKFLGSASLRRCEQAANAYRVRWRRKAALTPALNALCRARYACHSCT